MTRHSHRSPGTAGTDVTFFAPSLKRYATEEFSQTGEGCFMPISLTGSHCALMCDHCRAQILKWMQPATSPESLLAAAKELKARGANGILVSGGSDHRGVVPLERFLGTMKQIKDDLDLSIMVHAGFTSKRLAAGLAETGIDAALIDIIGVRSTISEVCHLDRAPADYERSLDNLVSAGVPVSPHVVIGLERGRVIGEIQALEIIARYPVASLVLVGLLPLPNTPMSDIAPPAPRQFGELFLAARKMFPGTPVLLGCERPAGEHKVETDRLALEAGLDGIAFPAEGTVGRARALGLEPHFSEACCALKTGVTR